MREVLRCFVIMFDQIIDFNRTFVAQKGYEKYLTDQTPFQGCRKGNRCIQ